MVYNFVSTVVINCISWASDVRRRHGGLDHVGMHHAHGDEGLLCWIQLDNVGCPGTSGRDR